MPLVFQFAGQAVRHGWRVPANFGPKFSKACAEHAPRRNDQCDEVGVGEKAVCQNGLAIGRIECRREFGSEVSRGMGFCIGLPDQMRVNRDVIVGEVPVERIQQP